MSTFKTKREIVIKDGKKILIIPKNNFDSFSENILGLGQISSKSNQVDALSVMFDLEGFTKFCKQIDPQLAVPEFLSNFLKWIFQQVKAELTDQVFEEGYDTYASLPFMSKFMGDGLLFLWDTSELNDEEIANIVISMREICKKYSSEFIKEINQNIVDAPQKLRCGIARGLIYSVGNGNDFVGPCINVSARLQKYNSLSFCFSRRGIDPKNMDESLKDTFLVKKVDIRGIGETELICVLKTEFDILSDEEKKKFN
jgi:hypothetical protein